MRREEEGEEGGRVGRREEGGEGEGKQGGGKGGRWELELPVRSGGRRKGGGGGEERRGRLTRSSKYMYISLCTLGS